MKRPTNITIACIVILIIVIICVFAFKGAKKESENNMKNEEIQKSRNLVENTVNQNEKIENEVANEIESVVNEEQTQHEIQNEIENAIVPTETFSETPHNDGEKAIKIVEDDWNGSDVAFSVTGMDANGNYIVQVTDINTEVLAFYTVNVADGSFTKKEMN